MSVQDTITKEAARRFLLLKQGLYGQYAFQRREGALAYIRQAGCIQFDPIDVVGKNAELTLQSRVKGFRKKDLSDLLYKDRILVDYFDKELAIIPVEDWPYFKRYRDLCRYNGQQFDGLSDLEQYTMSYIDSHGCVSSSTLPVEGNTHWHSSIHWSGNWSGNPVKASHSILEQLYTTGDLVIHHKEGARKYYDLAEKHIPREILHAEDPLPCLYEHKKWRVKRRIGAVGLLWNRNSSAFLGIGDMNTEERTRIFADLLATGEVVRLNVETINTPFYMFPSDLGLLEEAVNETKSTRCEFLAPLDPMLWDRNLIEKMFDYRYSWEIYVPKDRRKYGYYVLPVLYGDRLVGRIEPVIRNGVLTVNGLWLEKDVRKTKRLEHAIQLRLKRFATFNDSIYEEIQLW